MSSKADLWIAERHPVNKLAIALGVDRMTLSRALKTRGTMGDATVKEAVDSITGNSERDNARRRREMAEAESAEIDAAEKRGRFVLKKDHEQIVADVAVQTRIVIEGAKYIPGESRMKLTKELAAIKLRRPDK